MGSLQTAFQHILDRGVGDPPFLGGFIVAMQVEPDTRRQVAAGPVVFEDDHAGVVQATMQDGGDQGDILWVLRVRLFQASAQCIGLAHFAPGGDHHLEIVFLLVGERQGTVVVATGHFLLDKAEGGARLFEKGKKNARLGWGSQQAIEEMHELPFGNHRVGQRQLGQIVRSILDFDDLQRDFHIGRVHSCWPR